mmetsp:Transcript_27702/g.67430  ORF Transcript_27702/g.67430 Transcript_27702/m.67430 type:complete len:246 (+) Transcript_27702:113-850(+)|eukprot:CAMPEP_0113658700 /NCGR_PEP_ID=MMETSP0017_2-20120614/31917_1 /TAXON_ID=2856 /ORGANISM="Cylindrotheca closterium" /LENGTH=245 /DNA_ID=CAMNT_0000573107 /DNA_START=27 /DNA_END=767 /DNA_ORIENTATION=+ /assembly_acc=CAM_ASM_000147
MMSIQSSLQCWICLLLAVTTSLAVADPSETTASIAPSVSPTTASIVPTTVSQVPTTANSTLSPAPSTSEPPTMPPTASEPPTVSPAPSKSPAPSASVVPTSNSTESIPPSQPPSKSPSPSQPPSTSPSPSLPPSTSPAPSQVPTVVPVPPSPHHHVSAWAILGKTFAWLLVSALAILAFGALFSNRYRLFYYLESAWYTFLGWNITRKILRFLRLDGYFGGYRESSLNGIIFDNDLTQGLMMQDA